MGRYKRIIAFSLVLILGLSASFNCYASGSHSGGGFSNPDAITDEDMFEKQKENVDVEIPAPADTTIQSSKNSKGEIIHTLHWRNPASLVPHESDSLQVQVACQITISYNDPTSGGKGSLTSDKILLGTTPYTTSDTGYSTNLNDNVKRYLDSIKGKEEFLNRFGYLNTLVDGVALTPDELASAIEAALSLDVGSAVGDTISKNAQVLDDAYHFSANFQYQSVKYYLRYYKEKNSTLCEKGSDGKYHASLTLYNNQMVPGVSNTYPFSNLGNGESCTYEFESDYPIICCVDNPIVTCVSQWNRYYENGEYHDLVWCSGGNFTVDMYSFFSDGTPYCIGGFSGSAAGEGEAPLKVGIEQLFDVSNAGLYSGYGDGTNPGSPSFEDLTKLYTDFMAGNPDPDVFTSNSYQASVWTSVVAKFTAKTPSSPSQDIEKEQTVTTYDQDGKEVSIDVTGIEGWLAKIYKKECEILNWIKLNLIVNIADNIFDALIGDISAAASSLSNTSSTAFPVSIYKDVITVSTLLAADPVTPKFTLRLYYPGLVDAKEEISFEQFETMHNLLVAFMTLFCIASLFPLTRHTLDIMSRIKGGSS